MYWMWRHIFSFNEYEFNKQKRRIIRDPQDLSIILRIYPERYRFAVKVLQTIKISFVNNFLIGCNIKISKSMTHLKCQKKIYFENTQGITVAEFLYD